MPERKNLEQMLYDQQFQSLASTSQQQVDSKQSPNAQANEDLQRALGSLVVSKETLKHYQQNGNIHMESSETFHYKMQQNRPPKLEITTKNRKQETTNLLELPPGNETTPEIPNQVKSKYMQWDKN